MPMLTVLKLLLATTLAVLLATLPLSAQTPDEAVRRSAEAQRGKRQMLIGVTLAAAGLLVLPVTEPGAREAQDSQRIGASIGLVAVGAGVAWFGARKWRKASNPHTQFGLVLGKRTSVQVRRAW